MQTGRTDLNHMLKISSVPSDEPVFLIRGQDAVSGDVVRAWAARAKAAGAPLAVVEQALQQAGRMDAWPTKKVADADHLTEAEQKQLAYQLERRAWNAQVPMDDHTVIMAEVRAASTVLHAVRRVVDELLRRGTWLDDGTFVYDPPRDQAGTPEPDRCAVLGLHRTMDRLRLGGPSAPRPQADQVAATDPLLEIRTLEARAGDLVAVRLPNFVSEDELQQLQSAMADAHRRTGAAFIVTVGTAVVEDALSLDRAREEIRVARLHLQRLLPEASARHAIDALDRADEHLTPQPEGVAA